jgi:hypothetical protein
MRDFADHLIALETARKSSPTESDALVVCSRLRPHLATLMGTIGFRALLSRALALAVEESPSLRTLRIKVDGSFEESQEPGAAGEGGAEKRSEGGVVLVAHLLGLLVTFIGEDLTLRLVREIWPKASLDGSGSDKGSKNAAPK